MTQPNLLELAKQGNPKAIAALMNRQLQPKGITAKVALKGDCLQVMLEGEQAPDQQSSVAFVRKGLMSLAIPFIEEVKLYGRKTGEDFPTWTSEYEMTNNQFKICTPNENKLSKHEVKTLKVKKDNQSFYEAIGVNGQIRLTRNRVIISRKGALGFLSQGWAGEKEIPLNRITAIQFKPCDEFTNGYIQLSLQGGIESRGGVFKATQDENSVVFSTNQQAAFEEVKKYINSVMDGEPINFDELDFSTVKMESRTKDLEDKITQLQKKRDENFKKIEHQLSINIVGWMLGLFFGLLSLALLSNGAASGLTSLLVSLISIPITFNWIKAWIREKSGFEITNKHRLAIGITGIIITFMLGSS